MCNVYEHETGIAGVLLAVWRLGELLTGLLMFGMLLVAIGLGLISRR